MRAGDQTGLSAYFPKYNNMSLSRQLLFIFTYSFYLYLGFPGSSAGKESIGNMGDLGLIPGWGRSPGGRHGNHTSILAWDSPWTEEPGGLQPMG